MFPEKINLSFPIKELLELKIIFLSLNYSQLDISIYSNRPVTYVIFFYYISWLYLKYLNLFF